MRRQLRSLLHVIAVLILTAAFFPTPGLALSSADLVVHYVEGIPAEDQEAYTVHAYLSVLDENGNAIKDLAVEDLSITEDSQTVEIDSLAMAGSEPISVVLVLNTSRLMRGPAIAAARTASTTFIASLDASDQVALLTYNDEIETVSDFTTDHQDVQGELERVDGVTNTGACLYDAIYQAIQMTAGLTGGQRAIVVLTNGEDEAVAGGACSSMTVDDVINAASEGGMRVPVYTIGLGAQVDEQDLERISTLTGGRYHYAADNDALDPLFLRLATHFNAQYMLEYTSYAPAGAHTLAVKVDYSKAQDQDTRNFVLPPFPRRVSFTAPLAGEEIGGTVRVAVEVSGDGEPATQVAFEINGETIASDDSAPFEVEIDFDAYEEGELTIQAVAQGADGSELARASETVLVSYDAAVEEENEGISTVTLVVIAAVVLASFLALLLLVVSNKNKKKKKKNANRSVPASWSQNQTVGEIRTPAPVPAVRPAAAVAPVVGSSDATMIETPPTLAKKAAEVKAAGAEIKGSLTVEFSDDATMIGHRFDMNKAETTLGRSADNDITFPKDSPISRHHAKIEARETGLFLIEVVSKDDAGVMKPPTFGTFVNEAPLPAGGATLRNGDILRLGKRVRIKFEIHSTKNDGAAPNPDELDKTIG